MANIGLTKAPARPVMVDKDNAGRSDLIHIDILVAFWRYLHEPGARMNIVGKVPAHTPKPEGCGFSGGVRRLHAGAQLTNEKDISPQTTSTSITAPTPAVYLPPDHPHHLGCRNCRLAGRGQDQAWCVPIQPSRRGVRLFFLKVRQLVGGTEGAAAPDEGRSHRQGDGRMNSSMA